MAGQSVRAVSRERHGKTVKYLFDHECWFAWPRWLYALGMPPRGYSPILATLNPKITCHRLRSEGQTRSVVHGRASRAPEPEHEKRSAGGREDVDAQNKTKHMKKRRRAKHLDPWGQLLIQVHSILHSEEGLLPPLP